MSYRREEQREVYRDADGVPVARRAVEEERVAPDPAYEPTVPLQSEVVRERVVEQPHAAPPVADTVSERVVQDEATDRVSMLDLLTRLIWFLAGLLIVDLIFRFAFKATGANTGSSFVRFVYNSTAAFVAPFRGIFSDSVSGNNVFEASTLVAIVVYAVLAFFITWLLGILLGGPSRGVREYRRDVRRY